MLSVKMPQNASSLLTLPQLGASDGLFGTPKAQLSADHTGRHQVPLVVTDGPPFSILEHLHSALPDVGTASQPHQGLLKRHGVLLSAKADAHLAVTDTPLPSWSPPSTLVPRLGAKPVLDFVCWRGRGCTQAHAMLWDLLQAPSAALPGSCCPGLLRSPLGPSLICHSNPGLSQGPYHQHLPLPPHSRTSSFRATESSSYPQTWQIPGP